MTPRFEGYGRTALGRRLAEIVTAPERYAECRAFSREGFPAVTALVSLSDPNLSISSNPIGESSMQPSSL